MPYFYSLHVDAIDNITTKVDLLEFCHTNNIKVDVRLPRTLEDAEGS